MKRIIYILLVILSLGAGVTSAQNLELPNKSEEFSKRVFSSFQHFSDVGVSAKIYIQTDKPYYSAGDDIWVKGYLLNSVTHKELSDSKFMYVELIDSQGSLYSRVKIKADDYGFHNNIPLSKDIPAGEYTLRAYTQQMQSWSEELFFYRNIEIVNPIAGSSAVATSQTGASKSIKGGSSKIDVQFMPESGVLMAGELQTVAFKAVGVDGLGRDIEGVVYGDKSGEVAFIQSSFKGMGSFSLTSDAEQSYYAVIYQTGRPESTFRVDLPKPVTSGCTIRSTVSGKDLIYKVVVSDDLDYTKIGVVIHSRGRIFASRLLSKPSEIVRVPLDQLPEGILTIAMVNSLYNTPIAERLIFAPYKAVEASVTADKRRYPARSLVELDIKVADGNFALAVTDRSSVEIGSSRESIVSNLMLSSDLGGYVEGATDYFVSNEVENRFNLDLLMLTQGWRRFSLSDVLRRSIAKATIPAETKEVISGGVVDSLSRDVKVDKLMLFYPESGELEALSLVDSCRFELEMDDYPDGTKMMMQVIAHRDSTQTLAIKIDPDNLPKPRYWSAGQVGSVVPDSYRRQSKERYDSRAGETVEAENIAQREEIVVEMPMDSAAVVSYSLDREVVDSYTGRSAMELLTLIPGVNIVGGEVSIVSRMGVLGRSKVFVNDNIAELDFFAFLLADQVAAVDFVVKEASIVFDPDATLGDIYVTLKESVDMPADTQPVLLQSVQHLGYKPAEEFYQPKYDVAEVMKSEQPDLRTTIYWEPRIKVKGGRAKVSFYTADGASTYDVVLEGITSDGEVVRYDGSVERR